jgi:hypothetical protein
VEASGADAKPDVGVATVDVEPPGGPRAPDGAGAGHGDDEGEGEGERAEAAVAIPEARQVHRLRDLDRRGRVWAAVLAAALLLAPALAFAWAAPDWMPANDPALMAFRALDVGTSRTPLTGQPSTSANYVAADQHVDHPGPLHFYLMAVPVRLLGSAIGMLVVSVAITGGSVLLAAWAIFRQLGRTAGALAAVALGAITFTTGAATLVNPVSSNIARYPMLCSMVLLWCLVCGDLRLLPLATAVVSFTAQQHLSVLPALSVGTALGLAAGAVAWSRDGSWRDGAARRELRRWAGVSAAVALVLWSPILVEQFAPDGGNLTRMVEFAQDSDRPSVGPGSAVYQVVNVLGLPPLLGQTELTGDWLLERPSPLTWVSAGAVVVLLAGLALRWRRSEPRRLALVVMVGVLAVAGLANGASVPESLEKFRLPLYHWAFPLALMVVLALGLGLADLARRTPLARRPGVRPALAGCAVLAVAVPAVVNPSLDRRSNTMAAAYSPIDRDIAERAADEVVAHRDELDGEVALLGRGVSFEGIPEALGLMLTERGVPVHLTSQFVHYVDDERLADRRTADAGLLVVVDDGSIGSGPAGELIADVPIVEGFDREAFDRLVAQADAAEGMRFGADVEEALAVVPGDILAAVEAHDLDVAMDELFRRSPDDVDDALKMAFLVSNLADDPTVPLLDRDVLDFLVEHPVEQPRLDPDLVRRLRDSLPEGWSNGPLQLEVYLLDREELLDSAFPAELP